LAISKRTFPKTSRAKLKNSYTWKKAFPLPLQNNNLSMLKNLVVPFYIFSFLLFSISSCKSPQKPVVEIAKKEPKILFNLPADSFYVETELVRKNENLSDIFLKKGVSYNQMAEIVEATKSVFDVRKIKAGNSYYVFKNRDASKSIRYLVYERNRVEYVVFDLKSPIKVIAGRKELIRILDTLEGTVNSSLWNSIIENKASPELANELSDIYGWTIDFFGIQKGDSYRVYYERFVVENDTFGIGRIFAAKFNHMKTDYNAYYFTQGSVGEYFDEKGNSLRKAFLKAPLQFKRVSSHFSNSRMHPVLKIRRPHHGVDYAAASGTPVYTIGDGVVLKKAYQASGGGNYVTIKHNATYTTTYMHLKAFANGIQVGKRLKQGDLVGYVGQTGLASGPHLDFRVFKNGSPIDPLKLQSPPAEPINQKYKVEFLALRDSLNKVLYSK
jgi:murein DD-endopeptidase MepM/ murein hydrolase activator NlpD